MSGIAAAGIFKASGRGGIMFVLPWLTPTEQPSTLLLTKLIISAVGFIILCLGARLYLLARKR